MRGYDNVRDELEDYDDYYEEDECEEEYEEEEAEEEPRKPTQQELEYLELRQKIKERIRKKRKKESSGSGSSTSRADSMDHRNSNKLPYDNYGSFFGPSQPVIAPRVIEECKSYLENPNFASKVSNSHHIKKNQNKVSDGGSKSISHNLTPKVSEVKVKAQKLKDTRDYSFLLSDDAELPAPSRAPSAQNLSVRNSEGRPAHQAPGRSKQPSSNSGKHVPVRHEEQKRGFVASHLPPKSGPSHKLSSASKFSMASADSKKQLGNNSRNGPGRPDGPKAPPKMSTGATGNKSSTPGMRNAVTGVQKSLPSKVHSSVPRRSMEQRKDIREPNKPKMIPKQPVASSKPLVNKPGKQNSMNAASQDHRPKKKVVRRHYDDVEDEMDVSRMIRSMFNYNPKKFVDDDDDDNMEAGFDEILREEKRSALIAKREDEEQLRLIEEEEEREQRRRMAKLKKRKLGE